MDVKDPMVSFVKSRRAVASTMAKFQISALTTKGHYTSGAAMPSVNDATAQPCAAYKEEDLELINPLTNERTNHKRIFLALQQWHLMHQLLHRRQMSPRIR